ncbi:MAG: YlxR family protein [Lachnospiraceae bacterium]|nr:YlxR family protein [Lachnospiraceae bacterium]
MEKLQPVKKSNRTPQRRCVGCGNSFDQNELIRVRKAQDGSVVVATGRDEAGRSAYICKNVACLEAARKKRGFDRSFRCAVSQKIYDKIMEELLSK